MSTHRHDADGDVLLEIYDAMACERDKLGRCGEDILKGPGLTKRQKRLSRVRMRVVA